MNHPDSDSDFEKAVRQLLALAEADPETWKCLIGHWFQQFDDNPAIIDNQIWERDVCLVNQYRKDPSSVEMWSLPADSTLFRKLTGQIGNGNQVVFAEAVRRWVRGPSGGDFEAVVRKAGWVHNDYTDNPDAWWVMASLKAMDEGLEKEKLLAQAKEDSPLSYERCMQDGFCGVRVQKKRKYNEITKEYVKDDHDWTVLNQSGQRLEQIICIESCLACDPDYHKRQRMSASGGRPTQFHAVPPEDRATDSQGRLLPWSLEWDADHPNARHQKRPPPEEKGPFGKSTRRKGSSRGTRTATPAKKENPVLDGFERALQYDMLKANEEQQINGSATVPTVEDSLSHRPPPENREPTQVYFHGYGENTLWAALSFYEKVSLGMICEDYERQPPAERRKYPNFSSAVGFVHPRPLTRAESMMARKYAGGNHWIKVTFDTAAAADRAISHSPHLIQGHWVYAQLYTGTGPEVDEPILVHPDDRDQGLLGAPKPTHPLSRPQTASPQIANTQSRVASTLPRNFTTTAMSQTEGQQPTNTASTSPSTASSATATATEPNYPDLRQRAPTRQQPATLPAGTAQQLQHGRYFQRFPDTPRNIIRPHTEAFLPQPSWSEKTLGSLAEKGWIPHDIIGHAVPRLENGDFDWGKASFYWKLLYWLDCRFGTDLCGLKDDD